MSFCQAVLPKIEEVLTDIGTEREQSIQNLEISEHPAAGYGEKIFHVYDRETGQDLIRFHVRREKSSKKMDTGLIFTIMRLQIIFKSIMI